MNISFVFSRYDPLCEQLNDRLDRKSRLLVVLSTCIDDERRIMSDTKGTVHARKMDDFKLSSKMATMELQSLRGYTLSPESTFHQTRRLGDGTDDFGNSTRSNSDKNGSTLPNIRNKLLSARVPKNLLSTM
jgi:hypothetical protein